MKTLQEQWREYRDACYPQPLSAIQNRETHQAFIAGAFSAKCAVTEISTMPEAQAKAALQKYYREIDELLASIAHLLKNRN